MDSALVFPGQGSEAPGLGPACGAALAELTPRGRALLAHASEACGLDVARALADGARALERTDVLQPTLVALSLAAARALEARGVVPACVLGHSLGELAAACFALDLDDADAISLARTRGVAMAAAAEAQPGGMVALPVLPASLDGAVLAAENAPSEVVLSGPNEVVARWAKTRGATRLRVSGAWHSPAMEPAVAPFRAALHAVIGTRRTRVPIWSATCAERVDGDRLVDALATGIVSPVYWSRTLRAAAEYAQAFLFLAPGRVGRALARRTLGTERALHLLDDPGDLDRLVG